MSMSLVPACGLGSAIGFTLGVVLTVLAVACICVATGSSQERSGRQ